MVVFQLIRFLFFYFFLLFITFFFYLFSIFLFIFYFFNQVVLDDDQHPTLTVSPFSGDAHISPKIKRRGKTAQSAYTRLHIAEVRFFFQTKAEVLYNVKNGSPFITSKNSSKILSYENKHSLFFQTF